MEARELEELLQSLLAEQTAKLATRQPPPEKPSFAIPPRVPFPPVQQAPPTPAPPEDTAEAAPVDTDAAAFSIQVEPEAIADAVSEATAADAAPDPTSPDDGVPVREGRLAQLRAALYQMLDAEMEETELPEPLTSAAEQPCASAAAKAQRRSTRVGAILVVLALVGATALVRGGIGLVRRVLSDDKRAQEFAAVVYPLVIMDMPAFEHAEQLTDDQLLTAAVWSMVTQRQLQTYPETMGMCTVPTADLVAEVQRLFAVDRPMTFHTLSFGDDLRLYYDAEADSFYLPTEPKVFTYIPSVLELTRQEDGYLVDVAYQAEQPGWMRDDVAAMQATAKKARFTLVLSEDVWQIVSMSPLPMQSES